ncbi:hypothetical protein T12_7214 [Trichinella patagoniensis]|uniref:Uncharacterized protein n=1 Tax=Trichinella patagoniensis TaxID=990121 RepID=A0A0V0Z7I5_9BILA|nr:hypothetical protein T12_7214 [Trichinella patagoniensis]
MECKVHQHRNNAMRIRALIPRYRSVCLKPIRKFHGRLIKIYRRPKRATQIFVTHPIDRASAERSFAEVLEVSKKLFPDYHDRKTTCICGGNWKIVLVNEVTGEGMCSSAENHGTSRCEQTNTKPAWLHHSFNVVSCSISGGGAQPMCKCKCHIQSSISNLRKPVFNATCVVSVFYANWRFQN